MEQDDQEGVRTADDDNFIDDTGVDPTDRYDNDNDGHSPRHYAQVLILNCSYAIGNFFTSSF
jgi:transcription factor SPN1